MILDIVQAGAPVLREKARKLSRDEILSAEIQDLIRDMRETMHDAPGVGLAAPQVGKNLSLCVIEDRPQYLLALPPEKVKAMQREPVPFHVLINPKLVGRGETVIESEGCLSVNGYGAKVPRHSEVYVEALNEKAEPVKIQAKGWYARILQHEIDHLAGNLYIDRMDTRSFAAVPARK